MCAWLLILPKVWKYQIKEIEMKMRIVISLLLLFGVSEGARAAVRADSSTFTHKYEMDIKPSAEDLEPNGTPDFTETASDGGSSYVNDGILYLDGTDFFTSSATGEAWDVLEMDSHWSPFTIETRLKITSPTARLVLEASHTFNAWNTRVNLHIRPNSVEWVHPATGVVTILSTADNTDDFHTFRFAKPGMDLSHMVDIWRDGEALGTMNCQAPSDPAEKWDKLSFGDPNSLDVGVVNAEIDYFRFTKERVLPVRYPDAVYFEDFDTDPLYTLMADLTQPWVAYGAGTTPATDSGGFTAFCASTRQTPNNTHHMYMPFGTSYSSGKLYLSFKAKVAGTYFSGLGFYDSSGGIQYGYMSANSQCIWGDQDGYYAGGQIFGSGANPLDGIVDDHFNYVDVTTTVDLDNDWAQTVITYSGGVWDTGQVAIVPGAVINSLNMIQYNGGAGFMEGLFIDEILVLDDICHGGAGFIDIDINQDCYVNTLDLLDLVATWLDCNDPEGCN